MLGEARIPYGTWGSSYFPAWQTSSLAEVNIGQFAGEAMGRILGLRGVRKSELEYLVIGSTVPYHWKFWTAPMLASLVGHRIPGFHVEQACATGLQAIIQAANEVANGNHGVAGVLTFDGRGLRRALGTRFVFVADEFVVSAGKRIPSADYYEDFPQVENGIGLVRRRRWAALHAPRVGEPNALFRHGDQAVEQAGSADAEPRRPSSARR